MAARVQTIYGNAVVKAAGPKCSRGAGSANFGGLKASGGTSEKGHLLRRQKYIGV